MNEKFQSGKVSTHKICKQHEKSMFIHCNLGTSIDYNNNIIYIWILHYIRSIDKKKKKNATAKKRARNNFVNKPHFFRTQDNIFQQQISKKKNHLLPESGHFLLWKCIVVSF